MNIEKKYYNEINLLRGLVVILVVLAHSINATQYPSLLGFIHEFIYIFHMNALFLISGFLAYKVRYINNWAEQIKLLKNRAIRLLVPYLVCTLISVVLKLFLNQYAKNPLDINELPKNLILCINNPNGGIWFLYVLFILSIIAIFSYKVNFKIILGISIILKIVSLSGNFDEYIPLISLVSKYAIYYFYGIYIFNKYEYIKDKINDIKNIKSLIVIESVLIVFVGYMNIYYFNYNYINFMLSIMIIYVLYKFIIVINDSKILNICGKYGMSIYIIGYYVQQGIFVIMSKFLDIDYKIYWIFMSIIPIIGSIFIDRYIIKNNNILRFLILGEKQNKLKSY